MGFVNFYWLTTLAALPGIILFWLMMRAGLIDASIGTAGRGRASGDARGREAAAGRLTVRLQHLAGQIERAHDQHDRRPRAVGVAGDPAERGLDVVRRAWR